MNDILEAYLKKISKEKAPCLVFGFSSISLAIIGFVLAIVFYSSLGKLWFYVLSLGSLLLFGFLSVFLLKRYLYVRYLLAFWGIKKKQQTEINAVYESSTAFTIDKHFSSFKLAFEDSDLLFWHGDFGEIPFVEGKAYKLKLASNWIIGWEETHE